MGMQYIYIYISVHVAVPFCSYISNQATLVPFTVWGTPDVGSDDSAPTSKLGLIFWKPLTKLVALVFIHNVIVS